MRVAVFSAKSYDRDFLSAANAKHHHELTFLESRLSETTCQLAAGFPCVCIFVNDQAHAEVVRHLADHGTGLLALRSAGFNHVDLVAARDHNVRVVRVPAYSPYAVAEHTVGLMLALNRKFHKAYARVREGNFALEGLLGFDMHGKTVGVVGTGQIGAGVARIVHGFGCELLMHDVVENPELAAFGRYVPLAMLWEQSDIITLHCPLMPQTHHLIGPEALAQMKPGVMLINTSRGGLIDTRAVIEGLKQGKIGYLGLDVYEEEEELFFRDQSTSIIQDDVFMRLLTFPNVLVTGHQAFFTHEALDKIAATTLANITAFERGERLANEVAVA
jgi:D-lactate dehydrogenase